MRLASRVIVPGQEDAESPSVAGERGAASELAVGGAAKCGPRWRTGDYLVGFPLAGIGLSRPGRHRGGERPGQRHPKTPHGSNPGWRNGLDRSTTDSRADLDARDPPAQPGRAGPSVDDRLGGDHGARAAAPRPRKSTRSPARERRRILRVAGELLGVQVAGVGPVAAG